MTNAEKFKTAEERQSNFNEFCERYESCHHCPLVHPARLGVCRFKWLELEYKEVFKPCPFCGGDAILYKAWIPYVRCDNCGTQTTAYTTPDEAIAAWNRRVK